MVTHVGCARRSRRYRAPIIVTYIGWQEDGLCGAGTNHLVITTNGSGEAILNGAGGHLMQIAGTTKIEVGTSGGLGFYGTTAAARSTVSGALSGTPTLAQLSGAAQLLVAALGDKSGGIGLVHDTTT